jgi:hypothetical protein
MATLTAIPTIFCLSLGCRTIWLWGELDMSEHPQRVCSKNLQMNKMEQKECSLWWQAGAPKFWNDGHFTFKTFIWVLIISY